MFGNALRELITPFIPILNESKFLTEGVLTPEEFVRAGDSLVAACPGWRWSGSSQKVKYLPDNKQYLICSGVPCYGRVADLDASTGVDEGGGVNRAGERDESLQDWCVPSLDKQMCKQVSLYPVADDTSDDGLGFIVVPESDRHEKCSASVHIEGGAKKSVPTAIPAATLYAEMEEEETGLALDGATVSSSLPCRRYNCAVTYDKYYRVPRLWLNGIHETGSPLSDTQMLEDVMHEYAQRTVTIENMPLYDKAEARCISIHPCAHSQAFLNIVRSLQDCGKTPKVEQILFIFLKFMASIVPTIAIDWSFDMVVKGSD